MSQMLPPDMLAQLQGGGAPAGPLPPPPAAGGGIPPDMAAALGPPPAPPPEGALHGGSAAEGDPHDLVAQAIDLLDQAAKASPDDQFIQTVLKATTQLQGTLATADKAAQSGDIKPALAAETSY